MLTYYKKKFGFIYIFIFLFVKNYFEGEPLDASNKLIETKRLEGGNNPKIQSGFIYQ